MGLLYKKSQTGGAYGPLKEAAERQKKGFIWRKDLSFIFDNIIKNNNFKKKQLPVTTNKEEEDKQQLMSKNNNN